MSKESCHCKRSLIATGWGMCSSKGVSPWLYLYWYLPLSVLEVRGRFCLLGAYFAGTLKFFESFKCFFKNIFEYLVRGLACDRWSPFRPCGWDKMTKIGSKWFLVLWEVSFDLLAIGYQINTFVLEKLFLIHFIVPSLGESRAETDKRWEQVYSGGWVRYDWW